MPLQKQAILPQIALFSGLNAGEIQSVAQLLIEKHYAPGEMLFWEGEQCAGMFLVAQGEVKIFKTSSSGRELVIGLQSAPSSVAELPLFDGGPYPASTRAVGDVIVYFINKADFQQLCRRHPDITLKILATVGRRLRHLVATLEGITFGSVTARLAKTLLEMSRQAGRDEFALPVTHQELAARLGTVREVVSRNLIRFRADGLVRVEGHHLAILDRAGLEREAQAETP
ncbi:MAG TPA: Crp/Fnr family transcriptional regulator [Bryobacteraceae bacterium]|nr:Crp/Fnr family transcriptional regulator [Bryobacteraceae bacterium]